jgi:nitrate/nitrite-specific signal transduction histidine kinase
LAFAADEARVEISDDGVGRTAGSDDMAADHKHYGTTIMRERAQSLGGGIETESWPDLGTTVRLRFRPRALATGGDESASGAEPMAQQSAGQEQPAEST